MNCYCYNILKTNNYDYAFLKGINFATIAKSKNKELLLCDEWFDIWILSGICKTVGPLLSLGINMVVPLTIDKLSKY